YPRLEGGDAIVLEIVAELRRLEELHRRSRFSAQGTRRFALIGCSGAAQQEVRHLEIDRPVRLTKRQRTFAIGALQILADRLQMVDRLSIRGFCTAAVALRLLQPGRLPMPEEKHLRSADL